LDPILVYISFRSIRKYINCSTELDSITSFSSRASSRN